MFLQKSIPLTYGSGQNRNCLFSSKLLSCTVNLGVITQEKHLCRFYKKIHAIKSFFLGGGWYVIMIASCGRGVEGVVPDDYEFYLPEYVGHGFAKMVIKTISIATNLDPGPFQSVNYSTHLCIHIIKRRDKGISQIVKTQESNGYHKTSLDGSGCCRFCRLPCTCTGSSCTW